MAGVTIVLSGCRRDGTADYNRQDASLMDNKRRSPSVTDLVSAIKAGASRQRSEEERFPHYLRGMPAPEAFQPLVPQLAEEARQWARGGGYSLPGNIRSRDDLDQLDAFDRIRKKVGPEACLRPENYWRLVANAGEVLRVLRPTSAWDLRSPGPEYSGIHEVWLTEPSGWEADISGLVYGWIKGRNSAMRIAILHAFRQGPPQKQLKNVTE